jgi:amino acid permease
LFSYPLVCGRQVEATAKMAGVYEDQEISNKSATQYVTHDVEDYVAPATHLPSFRAGSANDGHIVSQHEQENLVRGLGQRHIQMIAIAGAIVSSSTLSSKRGGFRTGYKDE